MRLTGRPCLRLVARLFLADQPLATSSVEALIEGLHALPPGRSGWTRYICAILPSRIRLRIAGVPIMISCAATRPPPFFFISVCEITARSDSRTASSAPCPSPRAGNTSTMRSMVLAAELGVQRAEHQVAGLGGGERQADGLQVAHFADQDDVRVLAQRRAQRLAEAERVAVHLALVDRGSAWTRARTRSGPRW